MNTNELVKWINELIEKNELAKFYMSKEFRHLKKEIIELKERNVFDYTINNNGTLKDLFNNINKIC